MKNTTKQPVKRKWTGLIDKKLKFHRKYERKIIGK